MYARSQPLLLCDPSKQSIELLSLVDVEGSANGIIVFPCNATHLFCHITARFGQMQCICTPIRCIPTAFD